MENRKLKVFLCHSKEDKEKIRKLYQNLVTDGFDPWLDEEKLIAGQDWDLEIRKAVRESNVVVVCLSNNSTTKAGYVQKEIKIALDIADEQPEGTIYIIPARLEDCEVPLRLQKWHWVDLFKNYGYKKLRQDLEKQSIQAGITVAEKQLKAIKIEEEYQRVWVGEKRIRLPRTSYQLLLLLYDKYPNPITINDIILSADKFPLQDKTLLNREWLRVNIVRLKQQLGDDRYIETERTVGYTLVLNLKNE